MFFCALQRKCIEIPLSSEDPVVYARVGPVSANLKKKKKKNLGNNGKVIAALLNIFKQHLQTTSLVELWTEFHQIS